MSDSLLDSVWKDSHIKFLDSICSRMADHFECKDNNTGVHWFWFCWGTKTPSPHAYMGMSSSLIFFLKDSMVSSRLPLFCFWLSRADISGCLGLYYTYSLSILWPQVTLGDPRRWSATEEYRTWMRLRSKQLVGGSSCIPYSATAIIRWAKKALETIKMLINFGSIWNGYWRYNCTLLLLYISAVTNTIKGIFFALCNLLLFHSQPLLFGGCDKNVSWHDWEELRTTGQPAHYLSDGMKAWTLCKLSWEQSDSSI